MAMLADLVELARRGRHPQAHPHRRGRRRHHRGSDCPGNGGGHAGRLPPAVGIGRAAAEQVVELDRPKRAARRHGAKSDPLDATRAAREALSRDQLAQPRAAGHRRRPAAAPRPGGRRS
jgi:hypothetical protein